jgi:hypothetical protein
MKIQLDKYKVAIDEILERNQQFKKGDEERIKLEVETKTRSFEKQISLERERIRELEELCNELKQKASRVDYFQNEKQPKFS